MHFNAGCHHQNLILVMLLQGVSQNVPRLTSVLRHVEYFFLLSCTDLPTVRWLASFAVPYKTRDFIQLLHSMGKEKGQYLLVNTTTNEKDQNLLWLNLTAKPKDAIDTVFILPN